MATLRTTIAFLVGVSLVVAGIVDECPRIGAVAIGLLLMGLFTVPEAFSVIRGKDPTKGTEYDDPNAHH